MKENLLTVKGKGKVIIFGIKINIIKAHGKKGNRMVMDIFIIMGEELLAFGKKEK